MTTEKRDGEGEAFWRFSLVFYARPGVAPALIALQDRDGRDVNVILYALWLGLARGHAMDAADLAAAEAAAAPLREAVVTGLRGLRRRLRADPDPAIRALRRRVRALEIAAERLVQYRLAASIRPCEAAGDRAAIAIANLDLCLGAASTEAETVREAARGFSRRA
ncbi:MAG TPA: TIGR02444 family protein [Stellaceae bacterium]|jgi:uncharacterized protein (TIGR02444 family)|nr:TIGR02444 family protein [Stellaceae bacterium]